MLIRRPRSRCPEHAVLGIIQRLAVPLQFMALLVLSERPRAVQNDTVRSQRALIQLRQQQHHAENIPATDPLANCPSKPTL